MLKINNIFIVLLAVLISSFAGANILKIIDGDTIHIGKIKYRLYGIDAPEIKQKCKRNNIKYLCGVEATKFLQSLIMDDKNISCVNKNIDRYKRIVAVCHHLNEDLSKLMVKMVGLLPTGGIQKIMLMMKIMQKKINLVFGMVNLLSHINGEKKIDKLF